MLRRLALFVLLTALLVAGCVWLADRPGSVTVHWLGWRLDTTVPVVVFCLAALGCLLVYLQRLVGFLWAFPARWLAHRQAVRQREGYLALSDGLATVAGGDTTQASKLARKAETLLHDPQVTGLLSAQAAELAGDETSARAHYRDLLARPETALSGCQGMLALALKRKDYDEALDWAVKAWATGSKAAAVAKTLYDLQARARMWAEAELTAALEAFKKSFG